MTTARAAHTFHWPGERPCGKGHRWGGDRLNTYIATGLVVTCRTCSLCGSVRITRTGTLGRLQEKREKGTAMSDPWRPMTTKAFSKLLYDTSAGCSQPLAVAEHRVLREEYERLRALLSDLQWRASRLNSYDEHEAHSCIDCGMTEGEGHSADCRVGQALRV